MRTTLTLDDDVLEQARKLAARLHNPFRYIVNEALRAGLPIVASPAKQQKYKTRPRTLKLRQGRSLDNIQELMAQAEGENFR